MPTTFTAHSTTKVKANYIPKYIFVLQLLDGRFVIGAADNPAKRVSSINSGYNKLIPGCLQVHSIVGIKEQNEDRSFVDVVRKFVDKYGDDMVIAV